MRTVWGRWAFLVAAILVCCGLGFEIVVMTPRGNEAGAYLGSVWVVLALFACVFAALGLILAIMARRR